MEKKVKWLTIGEVVKLWEENKNTEFLFSNDRFGVVKAELASIKFKGLEPFRAVNVGRFDFIGIYEQPKMRYMTTEEARAFVATKLYKDHLVRVNGVDWDAPCRWVFNTPEDFEYCKVSIDVEGKVAYGEPKKFMVEE